MSKRYAIIIGAGPAGLTAAYELLKRSDIIPIVLEKSAYMGGISRTVNYKGNRIDIGGHRFFSKSDVVMNWWQEILPIEAQSGSQQTIFYQNKSRTVETSPQAPTPETTDAVMLVRERKSRIYFLRKFFEYPVRLDPATLLNLGPIRTVRIGFSYMRALAFPIRPERNLEEFYINRFGRELYATFFKRYTEKVWGLPVHEISAEWGAQRVKGLSVIKAIKHFFSQLLPRRKGDLSQKETETSLIERFLYPKYGPGQMWEEVARQVRARGGEIRTEHEVERIFVEDGRIVAVEAYDRANDERKLYKGDHFFSTMPVRELVGALNCEVPDDVREVASGLQYRDFLTVGLLLDDLKIKDQTPEGAKLVRDNWIYIQEPDVQVGRLQIFNNWSPYMVDDPSKVWVGMEYFCNDTDALWNMEDPALQQLGIEELSRIGIIDAGAVRDAVVIRQPKAYPGYFGTYNRFETVRTYLNGFPNLFLVGRNGMHKYNNQDHSMISAMVAVEAILAGSTDKAKIWEVNAEDEYHETVKR